MAVTVTANITMRKKWIVNALIDAGAKSADTAKALSETDLVNPDSFPEITEQLVESGVIRVTGDGKYYVDHVPESTDQENQEEKPSEDTGKTTAKPNEEERERSINRIAILVTAVLVIFIIVYSIIRAH